MPEGTAGEQNLEVSYFLRVILIEGHLELWLHQGEF